MNPMLIYALKVNLAIALFYLFYSLFFANDTFWKTRRFYLLFSIFISFAYPVFSIENWLQQQTTIAQFVSNYAVLQEFTISAHQSGRMDTGTFILVLYGCISAVLLVKLLVQMGSVLKIKHTGKKVIMGGIPVIIIDKAICPFSFLGNIYLNPKLHKDEEIQEILVHEMTHVKERHSLDVLAGEILTILFWINPASWLIKNEIRHNLEFLADNQVVKSGFDSRNYQYHLLQLSYQKAKIDITNRFNVLPLKKRIIMMNQQKTSKAGILKYLLIAPLLLALIFSSNAETLITNAKEVANQKVDTEKKLTKTIRKNKKTNAEKEYSEQKLKQETPLPPMPKVNETAPPKPPSPPTPPTAKHTDDQVFMVVDKMPEFAEGEMGLYNYLVKNVKYPVEAKKKGIQGRVICSFVVKADGTIADVKVLSAIDPYLDAEAIRAITAMPRWTPGEQKGQKVDVQYTLPINFKLDGKPKSNHQDDKTGEIPHDKTMNSSGNP